MVVGVEGGTGPRHVKPQQIQQKARKHVHGENAKVMRLARKPVALRLLSTPKDSPWVTHCGRREVWGPSLVPFWIPGPQFNHKECMMKAKDFISKVPASGVAGQGGDPGRGDWTGTEAAALGTATQVAGWEQSSWRSMPLALARINEKCYFEACWWVFGKERNPLDFRDPEEQKFSLCYQMFLLKCSSKAFLNYSGALLSNRLI